MSGGGGGSPAPPKRTPPPKPSTPDEEIARQRDDLRSRRGSKRRFRVDIVNGPETVNNQGGGGLSIL